MKKIYVGNLPYNAGEADLRQLFEAHGTVASAAVVIDRETGKSRGFGFVEMTDDDQAGAAVAALNGSQYAGRALTVNEARPKDARAGGWGASSARGSR